MRSSLVLLCLFALPLPAQQPAKYDVIGVLTAVDATKKRATLHRGRVLAPILLGFNDKSKIALDGKESALANLKAGMTIQAVVAQNGYCYELKATSPPAPPPPPLPVLNVYEMKVGDSGRLITGANDDGLGWYEVKKIIGKTEALVQGYEHVEMKVGQKRVSTKEKMGPQFVLKGVNTEGLADGSKLATAKLNLKVAGTTKQGEATLFVLEAVPAKKD